MRRAVTYAERVAAAAGKELTLQELEALQLYGCGFTARQIGKRLHLATSTVDSRFESARLKLRVHTTNEAVAIALDAGLIPVEVADAS